MNESAFAKLYAQWIWLGPVALALSGAALVHSIRGVVTAIRTAHLFRVPLAASQEVRFSEAAPVVLSTEGPRLSRRFAGLSFDLRSEFGQAVPKRRVLLRAQTSGIATVQTNRFVFDIPHPGRYSLTVAGLGAAAGQKDDRHNVVFTKTHLAQTMSFVVAIVISSGFLIVSLVFFLLRLNDRMASG